MSSGQILNTMGLLIIAFSFENAMAPLESSDVSVCKMPETRRCRILYPTATNSYTERRNELCLPRGERSFNLRQYLS